MQGTNNVLNRGKTPMMTILLLAWPIVLEQVMLTLVQYVDTAMVGSLGADATAAVAINQSVINLINGIVMSAGIGFTAMVARYVGAGDLPRARRVVSQGIVVSILLGLLCTLVMCLLSPYIPVWMGGEPEILEDATSYLFIISVTMLFKTVSILFTAILRGSGDTKTPMAVNILVNLINVVGNFLLIYSPRTINVFGREMAVWGAGLGVSGAAIATSISIVVGGLIILGVVFFKNTPIRLSKSDSFRPDPELLGTITRISLPAAGERLAMNFGQIAQTFLVTGLGTVALASHHLASTAESVCFMPAFGFSAAVTTLVGQSLGAKEEEKAEAFAKETVKISVIFMSVMALGIFLGADFLMRLFTQDPEVIARGTVCLQIVAISEPFFAVGMALSGTLRGAGDTKWPFYITLLTMWGIRIVLSSIAIYGFGTGLYSIWIFMCLDQMARCFLFTLRFRTGHWKYAMAKHD